MKKNVKKAIIITLVCLVVLGGIGTGVFLFLQNRSSGEVNVYPVDYLSTTGGYMDQVMTDGNVVADRMQSVLISSTQTVTEIFVQEGQSVQVGDRLLAYDTTLSEVDLQRAQITLQQKQLELKEAQDRLKEIGTYKVGTPGSGGISFDVPSGGSQSQPSLSPDAVPLFQGGSGTMADPYVFLWSDELTFYDGMIDYLLALAAGENPDFPADPDQPVVPPTATATPAPTPTPTPTPTATPTPTPGSTPGADATQTPDPTEPPETTPEPTDEPEPTEAPVVTPEPTPAPTAEPEPPVEDETPVDGAAVPMVLRAPVLRILRGGESSATPRPGEEDGTIYMVFEIRESNAVKGQLYRAFEMAFHQIWGGYDQNGDPVTSWMFQVTEAMYTPSDGGNADGDYDYGFDMGDFYIDTTVYYTATEINQMKNETNQQIAQLQMDIKLAEQDLKQKEYELSNGEVTCTTAGVVKTVRDPDEALAQNQPVIVVSGGGGFYVTGVLGEFDLDTLSVGDTVTVSSWQTGDMIEAQVTEISMFPVDENEYHWYNNNSGNSNISKYPVTVMMDEDAPVWEGQNVDIYLSGGMYNAGGQSMEDGSNTFYLENPFLRTENGRSYVYVAVDDHLEKRYVTTGRSLWGDWTEILDGLTKDDYVAFPYGRAVKDGTKVVYQEDTQALWNNY